MRRLRTLRAKPLGRTTRKGLAVRKPQGKPLPLHLQVLPQPLTPTPRNPGCYVDGSHWGAQVMMAREWPLSAWIEGRGLSATDGAWQVDCLGQTFYTDDVKLGFAWVQAAKSLGMDSATIKAR